MRVVARTDEKARAHLMEDPNYKIRRSRIIHGHGDYAAIRTSQKCRNPRGGIRSPEYDALAFENLPNVKFAGEPEGGGSH